MLKLALCLGPANSYVLSLWLPPAPRPPPGPLGPVDINLEVLADQSGISRILMRISDWGNEDAINIEFVSCGHSHGHISENSQSFTFDSNE